MTEEQEKGVEECYQKLVDLGLDGCIIAIPVGTPRPRP